MTEVGGEMMALAPEVKKPHGILERVDAIFEKRGAESRERAAQKIEKKRLKKLDTVYGRWDEAAQKVIAEIPADKRDEAKIKAFEIQMRSHGAWKQFTKGMKDMVYNTLMWVPSWFAPVPKNVPSEMEKARAMRWGDQITDSMRSRMAGDIESKKLADARGLANKLLEGPRNVARITGAILEGIFTSMKTPDLVR
ncbi:hypothetical protein HY087_02830 [Candidatus Gottesmanbacteria bacterium]|nr:hypothetical protein [Candidatus Gottesmanbacteria bacterium]